MRRIYPFSLPKSPTVAAPPLVFHHHAAEEDRRRRRTEGEEAADPKERPTGMTNATWAADVERRQTETRGRVEREKKLVVKRATAVDEQASLVSMAMGQPRVGQFPAGS
jgi:hypothetical protein